MIELNAGPKIAWPAPYGSTSAISSGTVIASSRMSDADRRDRQQSQQVSDDHQVPAVHPIRECAGRHQQQHLWDRPRGTHEREDRRRGAEVLVDEPRDREHVDPVADHRDRLADPQQAEVAVLQRTQHADALEQRERYRSPTQPIHESRTASHEPGAPGGSRTPNLLIRSQMLYPLSYRRRSIRVTPAPGPQELSVMACWRSASISPRAGAA